MNTKSIVAYSDDSYKVLVPSALSSSMSLQTMLSDPEYIGVTCQVTEPTNVYVLYKLNCTNCGYDQFGGSGTGSCLFCCDDLFTLEYRNSEVFNSADTKVVNDTLYNVLESDTFSTVNYNNNLQVWYVAMRLTITPDSVSTHTYISDRPGIYKCIQSHPYTIQSGTSVFGVNASIASCMMACACNSGSGNVKYAFTSSYHQNPFKPLGSATDTTLAHINDTMTVAEQVKFILGYVKGVSRQFYFHDKVIEAAAMTLTRNLEIPAPSGNTLPTIAMTLELSLSGADFGTVAWSYIPSEDFISSSTQEDFDNNITMFDIDSMTADSQLVTMLTQYAQANMSGSLFGGIKGIKVGNVLIAAMVNIHVTNQTISGNSACYVNSLPDTIPSAYTAQVEALQSAITSSKDARIAVLNELNDAQNSLDEVQDELTAAQENLATVQTDLTSAEATLTTKQSDIISLQEELTALQEAYEEAGANIGAVTTEYANLLNEVTRLESEQSELTISVTNKQSQLADLTQQITLSNSTMANIQTQLSQLQSDLTSAQTSKELVQSELDAVTATLNDLEASPEYQTYINLQQQLQSVRGALTDVTEAYEDIQAEYNQLVQMTYNETRVCKAKDKCPWASVNILNGFIETIDYGD